ncbi:MAG: tetratricopeptide repeat-containing sensor histidine kinase [Chitinophagaceae bacterium]
MRLFFTILGLFITLQINAQKQGQAFIDSLVSTLPTTANDTIKARTYNIIFNELININTDEALGVALEGLKHVEKMKWQKGIAVFSSNIGRVYQERGIYDSAINYYNQSLISNLNQNEKRNAASDYNNLATAAKNIRSDYTSAAKYYFKALKLAEEIKDSSLISVCLHNISAIYLAQQNFIKAIEFEKKALTIREQSNNADDIASSMESIGKIFYSSGNLLKAKEYFQKTISLYETTANIQGLASAYSSLALGFGNDYSNVIEARIKARELWNEINPIHITAITNTGNLGIAYLDVVRYDTAHRIKHNDVIPNNKTILLQKAEENLKTAILFSQQTGDMDTKSYFTGALSELQELKGDFKNAFYNFKAYKEIQDSIYSQENKNKIAAAESQGEIDKKNSELQVSRLTVSNQRKTLLGLVIGLTLFTIIGFLLYRQVRIRKKNNAVLQKLNKELDNANKMKAKFFSILSHDLRGPVARLINFLHLQKEAPGLLNEEMIAQHRLKITNAATSLLDNMENILLWGKSQMEQFKPEIISISVESLFEHLKSFFNSVENVSFHFNTPAGLIVETDENYLKSIMQNLTANAIKALNNTANASIEWKAWQQNGKTHISVSDNGPGFSSDFLKKSEIDNSVIQANAGLGMFIIRDLSEAIHCKIEKHNTREGGACITLEI